MIILKLISTSVFGLVAIYCLIMSVIVGYKYSLNCMPTKRSSILEALYRSGCVIFSFVALIFWIKDIRIVFVLICLCLSVIWIGYFIQRIFIAIYNKQ
jgi:hypothetical protein